MERDGYVDIGYGNGVQASALRASPHILWTHIDGPMMCWAGHTHWLTWRERLALRFGRTTPEQIAMKHWPMAIGWLTPPHPSRSGRA